MCMNITFTGTFTPINLPRTQSVCTYVYVQALYGIRIHRAHLCVYRLVKGTIMRRWCTHLYLLHYFCKKKVFKNDKEPERERKNERKYSYIS